MGIFKKLKASDLEKTITVTEIERLVDELTDPISGPKTFNSLGMELKHALDRLEEKELLVNCLE